MSAPRDYYQVLSVARNASAEQIRGRFRELARQRHPDRFTGDERARAERDFQEITEAFNILSSPHLRRQHDLELARPSAAAGPDEASRMVKFHLEAGVAFYRDGNYFAAAESFERVLRLDPGIIRRGTTWLRRSGTSASSSPGPWKPARGPASSSR